MRCQYNSRTSEYEIAYAGLAVRHNREAEAYYWKHLIAEALIMIPERYWYWRQIGRRKIIGHEGCHGALVGVGRMPGEPLVSVYSRQRIREGPYSLVASSRTSPGTSLSPEVADKMADIWINQSLVHVDYGDKSPYYIS